MVRSARHLLLVAAAVVSARVADAQPVPNEVPPAEGAFDDDGSGEDDKADSKDEAQAPSDGRPQPGALRGAAAAAATDDGQGNAAEPPKVAVIVPGQSDPPKRTMAKPVTTTAAPKATDAATSAPVAPIVPPLMPTAPTEPPVPPVTTAPLTTMPVETMAPATTVPALRTETTSLQSSSSLTDVVNKVNAPVMIAIGALCCVFLLVWGRKRKYGTAMASAGADSAISADGFTSAPTTSGPSGSSGSSAGATTVKSKVQYSRIDNPEDEDEEYGDGDFVNAGSHGGQDRWEDWEGDLEEAEPVKPVSTPQRIATPPSSSSGRSQPAEAPLISLSPPSSTTSRAPMLHPPRSAAPASGLHDVLLVDHSTPALGSSQASNSSNDSFEVISHDKPSPEAVEKQTEDDLFSQFGMVPSFKGGVQSSAARPPWELTSSAPSSHSSVPASASTSTAKHHFVTTSAPSTPATAMFAAELDDLSAAADAANEWGDDDEWEKGI
ncbi:TPA: hypothetical protein N0F65_003297 [Lagenidium giganteum]|uniref:Transmembrane protein n=1 Tax=Lagenidium giganteum TaxID=4803 RepID=A0AAV2YV51_9STRA|nr:TPA: hypothetical protein N0F65_003297 [Lagenidium giganteum]